MTTKLGWVAGILATSVSTFALAAGNGAGVPAASAPRSVIYNPTTGTSTPVRAPGGVAQPRSMIYNPTTGTSTPVRAPGGVAQPRSMIYNPTTGTSTPVRAPGGVAQPRASAPNGWRPAAGPYSRVPRVEADTSDNGLTLTTRGHLLRVAGTPSGIGSGDPSTFAFVEASVNKHPGASFGAGNPARFAVKKSTSVTVYPGDTAHGVAKKLQATGLGKIVDVKADGTTIIDTRYGKI